MSTTAPLASGTFRAVFIHDEHLVRKVNHADNVCTTRRFDANRREYLRWCRISKTTDARYFAAIVRTADGKYLQERAVMTLEELNGTIGPISDELQEVADRWGILDTHSGNVGIFPDGSLKFIDYADECCRKRCYRAAW